MKKHNNKRFKITEENLREALKEANHIEGRISLGLTIVEQSIGNTKLSNKLNSTRACQSANLILYNVISMIIIEMRNLVDFLRQMKEYLGNSENLIKLRKTHKQVHDLDETFIYEITVDDKPRRKLLKECSAETIQFFLRTWEKEEEERVQDFDQKFNEIMEKLKSMLTDNLSETHRLCVKFWKIRNLKAHFDIEKEEPYLKELRNYFNKLQECMRLINFIVDNSFWDYNRRYKYHKRSADAFWNL